MQKRLKGVPNLPFPPIVAGIYGLVAGFLVYATPQWLFEYAVDMSGVAQFVPAATPPLGEKARLMAAVASVFAVAALLFPILMLGQALVRKRRKKPPVIKRARGIVIADSLREAAPVAPEKAQTRAPIFADHELGAPLMSDEALAAAEELVLEEPLDAPSILAQPGRATPSHNDLAYEPFEADMREESAMEPNAPFDLAAHAVEEDDPAQAALARLSVPLAPPAAPVSQFQISVPIMDQAPLDPFAVQLEEPAPVAKDTSIALEGVTPVSFAQVSEPDPVTPVEIAPMDTLGFDDAMGVAFPQDDSFPPEPIVEPVSALEQVPVADPFAGFGSASDDGFDFSAHDPMRVSLFPEAAAPSAPAAAEPEWQAPAHDPKPALAESPAPPEDHSVSGLMARLNSAMGARLRHAEPELPPLKVGFGTGGRQPG